MERLTNPSTHVLVVSLREHSSSTVGNVRQQMFCALAWEKMMLASSALTRTSINSPWLTLTLLRVSLSQASYDTSPSIHIRHIGGFGKCSAGEPNSHALLVTERQDAASATVANQATR